MNLPPVLIMLPDIRPDLLVKETSEFEEFLEDPVSGRPTDEDPPIPLNGDEELIIIDECLGVYLPEERRIKVFKNNIEKASEMLNCKPLSIEYVVLYHEYAHAVIHLGTSRDDRLKSLQTPDYKEQRLKELTERYYSIAPPLHELLAQLLTYHTLRLIKERQKDDERKRVAEGLLNLFEQLSERQPTSYRIGAFLDTPRKRITESIHFIKRGWLVGESEPWKTIMLWP